MLSRLSLLATQRCKVTSFFWKEKEKWEYIDVALKLAEVYHIEKNQKMEKQVIDDFLKNNPKAIKDRRIQKYQAAGKANYVGLKDLAAR